MPYTPPYHIRDYRIYPYHSLPSTADMAKNPCFQDMDKYIVVAATQHAGRGRLGNTWQGDTGNLLFNMVSVVHTPMHAWPQLSLVAALAVSDVIDDMIGDVVDNAVWVQIKWPNDILVDGAKIAGILLETVHTHTPKPKISIGIGLNVVSSPNVESYPTCYTKQFGCTKCAMDIMPVIVDRYEQRYRSWVADGIQTIVSPWLARAWGMGDDIRIRTPKCDMQGIFMGLSESGELLLQTESGTIPVSAGEVVFG